MGDYGLSETRAPRALTDFDTSPSYMIAALGNTLSVQAARNLRRQLGLSLMEWRVLAVLAAEPGASPGRIVEFAAVNKSVVSRAVNSLLKRGLVDRAPSPDHGLRTHLRLTDAGWAIHDEGIVARLQAEERLLQGVSPAEREQLLKLLKALMGNVEGSP
jgi:DNA-binding MarR family transcriptional regulator